MSVARGSSVGRALPVLLSAALLAGCGVAKASSPVSRPSPVDAIPTTGTTPPAGVALTSAGARLAFGQPAVVGFAQNAKRRTTLRLTVSAVRRGRAADLAAYRLDDSARVSTPYYATVAVANLGPGDVGRASVPLWAVASDGTLVAASGFTSPVPGCASSPLPSPFATGATTSTCLVFLVPQGTTLSAMAFQPVTSERPITWRGKVATRPARKPRVEVSPVR